MGFFDFFKNNRKVIDTDIGNPQLYAAVICNGKEVLADIGWLSTPHGDLLVLDDDNGFFRDIFGIVENNPLYDQLRWTSHEAFVMMTSGVFLMAGIYATICARIIQKPLFRDYETVLQRFKNESPIGCVMKFLNNARGPHQIPGFSFDNVLNRLLLDTSGIDSESLALIPENQKALFKGIYHIGNAIGFYYL